MGDQRLGLRQFQLELITQEHLDLRLDPLGFVSGSGQPQQKVVAITHIPQPSIVRIVRVLAGKPAALLTQQPHRLAIPTPFGPLEFVVDSLVSCIAASFLTVVVVRQQRLLNKFVEPSQVNIGQNG